MKTTVKRFAGSRWSVHAEPEESFLRELVDTVWEQRPMHVGRGRAPLMTSPELFQTVVGMAEAFRRGEAIPEPAFRWCHDGKQIVRLARGGKATQGRGLPRAEDGSFAGYHERLSGLPSYFLQAPHLQAMDPLVWQRCQSFLTRLYAHVGVPSKRAFCDVYVGRYRSTPFGIHIDGASNFTFGIEGKKTLYLWEPELYHAKIAHLETVDYRDFLKDAIALTVGPGEIIYWPSRYWHIAEPSTELSVTMNVAYYGSYTPAAAGQRAVELAATARLAARRRALGEPEDGAIATGLSAKGARSVVRGLPYSTKPSPDLRVPTELRKAVDETVRELPARLHDDVTRGFVGHVTRLGFDHAPPLAREAPRLARGARVRRVCLDPVRIARLRSGALVCAANGHTRELADRPWVHALVRALNVRDAVRVDEHPAAAKTFLQTLLTWRAIDVATK